MRNKFGIVAVAVIIVAAIVGGLSRRSIGKPSSANAGVKTTAEHIESDYQAALTIIDSNYAGEVDYEKTTQAAIQGMLWTLDPHSNYFTRSEFQKLKEDQDSRFFGIGVSILQHRDGVYIQSLVENTPAARGGLRYGDRILEVDGKDAKDWTSAEVSKNVRGEEGVPVRIKIERVGSTTPLEFTIKRAGVSQPSIRNAFMVRPGVGYVGLTGGFQHKTDEELSEAIDKLKAQGMRQLVLDLRGNPGGLLEQAIKVSSRFIPPGQVITSVRGRTDYETENVYRSIGNETEKFPLVVLINHNSASASEIVAGAIQDHGRGLVVGQTSFGKGLVQKVFHLPFGSGLTLTTAKYYTPYGRSLQRDYSNGSLYDYYARHDQDEETAEKSNEQQQKSQTATPTPTPVPAPTGPAVTTAAGRVFYGGGGITPDIIVKPLAATTLRGRIAEAAFYFTRELASGQVSGLEDYKIEETRFGYNPRPNDYPITDRVIEAFRAFLQRDPQQGLNPAQIEPELDFVKLRLRDEIITAAYAGDAGNRVLLDSDPQVLRALEALPEARRLVESIRNSPSLG
ncbi:MAG: S41 family peptidase [Pyrinomonadaceae bacterium]|nr:S41 family peptidase [Pyrinomonadaceae bacterium]